MMRMKDGFSWVGVVIAVGAIAGCAANQNSTASDVLACAAPSGALESGESLDGWSGQYTLSMVASGEEERMESGRLTLHAHLGEFRQMPAGEGAMREDVLMPMYGVTDIDLEALGAVLLGDLASDDPASPGVLVIEQGTADGARIMIRMGSAANRRGVVRFDGGFTALTVTEIGDGSFGGTWASGIQETEASGYFCAQTR